MTERFDLKKAIKITGLNIHAEDADEGRDFDIACRILINALTELEQYRAIGSVEDCRMTVEKMNPQNPIRVDMCTCPECGTHNEIIKKRRKTVAFDTVHCWHCGQAISVRR